MRTLKGIFQSTTSLHVFKKKSCFVNVYIV